MSATASSTVAALAAVAATTTTTATVTTIATAAAAAAAAATHNNHSSNVAVIMAAGVGNSVGGVSANADGGMSDHLPLQLTTAKVDLDIEIDIQLLTNGYDGTTLTNYQITGAIIFLFAHLFTASSTPLPKIEALGAPEALDYAQRPNEVLPIQPLLLYPTSRNLQLQGRELEDDDNEIIFVKLLKRKAYRPTNQHSNDLNDASNVPRELTMKDIFYVKALANGQFSHQRLKLYRLPEFYAITVFRKGAKL